ncbi:dynein axonemal heavy chain 2-like [Ochlerotatus camptorhynchus]|uniref:dynein axonemal heavy chain 2-like n=1 Tax=Ochlerotatus camptorhynchus TaxID=644619 RepID=UPI0031D1222A
MADNAGRDPVPDNISELSSFSDSSDEGKKVVEVVEVAEEEADKPAYSDEDFETLLGFFRNMIYLFDYDENDFNDEVAEVIKLWLTDVDNPLLFIFYDGDLLSASLTFPTCAFNDIMYFMREPDQLFNVIERFHDDLMFGTLHNDIEGSLLVLLEQVYGPLILSNTEWSENVKAHVVAGYNTFMTYLTDIHYKLSGFTLLYVPREGSNMEVQEVVLNRTLIKRLEAVVIDWTSQIRSTINDTQHFVPNDLICPSDEYSFWLYRHEILSAIQSQFRSANIQHILKILDLSQSLYTKPLREVLDDLMKEIEMAESNIPFLKLLVDPCFAIRSLDNEDDLCSQLIYVMNIIRFIGLDSSHLRQDESITKLFLYLSNEIVSCCMQSIDIDKILSGSPDYGIDICNIKINCCESYKIIYEEMLEHFKRDFTWKLDYAGIFNRVDSFMQRLYDTLDICNAMKIFGKNSGSSSYKNYQFSCNNAAMYEDKCNQVQEIFTAGIERIQSVSGSILDINNKEWYNYIANFREMLKNLDDIVENLLSNVFLVAENLEEKINVLITLLNFYKRENIKESYMRKISEIWHTFKEELTTLSKTVSSGINHYPTLFPRKSGQYALLKIKFERICRLNDLLERCRFLPQYSESDDILTLFESCEKQVKIALKTYNDSWIKSISPDLGAWYHRNLICRSQVRPGLLECHIERRMLVIFEESYYFKVSGATVPSFIDMEKNDNVKLTFDNVIRIILYFNNVVSSISDKERLFFKPLIQQTERKLEPLRGKLTWEEDLSEFIDNFVVNVKELLDVIQVYKKENIKIAHWMESIYNLLLFKLKHEHAQQLVDFTNDIKTQKKASISELVRVYSETSKHIFCIYENLGSNLRRMGDSWAQYVQKIDHLLKAAVFNSSLNTLDNIRTTLQRESTPILSIELMLNKQGIAYQPPLESIETALKRLPTEVTSIIKFIPSMCQRFQIDSDFNLYDEFLQDSRFQQVETNIHGEISNSLEELHTFREKWNVFRPFWSINRQVFIEKFKLSNMTSEAFQKNIEKFEELLNQLTTQQDSTICKCVEVDALKLKYAITNHINDWQVKYIEYLKCVSYGRIIEFHNKLNHNMDALSVEPVEVKDLKVLEETYQSCFDNIPDSIDEIQTIIKYFNVLEACVQDLLPEAYNLRRNIHQNWQRYTEYLNIVKEQIENYQNQFKLSMANNAADLKVNALEMLKMLDEEMPTSEEIMPEEAFSVIEHLIHRLEQLEAQEKDIKEKLALLGVEYHSLDVIVDIRRKLEGMKLIWQFVKQWQDTKQLVFSEQYGTMKIEEIENKIGFIDCHFLNLNDTLTQDMEYPIFKAVKLEVQNFHITFSMMVHMRSSHMKERHWRAVEEMTNLDFKYIEIISFEEMIDRELYRYEEMLSKLCYAAQKEFEIEVELATVENAALSIRFNVQRSSKDTFKITSTEKCFLNLKTNITVIDRLLQSPYRKPFQEKINCWETNLNFLKDLLEALILIETQCKPLYEIFKTTETSQYLNDFNQTFKMCYEKWSNLLEFITRASLLNDMCPQAQAHLQNVEILRKKFDELAQNLQQLLENQRNLCFRLYLVPDVLLIKLIAFPTNVEYIQQILFYTFENIRYANIRQLDLPRKYKSWEIDGIQTVEGENITFNKPIIVEAVQDPIGVIREIEKSIFAVLKVSLHKCLLQLKQNYFKRIEHGWFRRWTYQALLKSTHIENTLHIRNALVQTNLLGKFKPLKMLRTMHNKLLNEWMTSKLSTINSVEVVLAEKKYESLLIAEINTRDVIENLIKAKVSSISDFEWTSQIRSYWNDETKSCSVVQLASVFPYGYECKTCDEPILVTPHSNRMLMTVTNIVKSKYVPYLIEYYRDSGFQLLKQLAMEIATLFVTLSCDSGWEISDVTRCINGIRKLQAWICFKNIDTLSSQVRSALNAVIREAFVEKSKQTVLDLKNTKPLTQFHIFATINSRVDPLPEIERSIMRPIYSTLPDQIIFIQNLLCCYGFKQYLKLGYLIKCFLEYIQVLISSQYYLWTPNRIQNAIRRTKNIIRKEKYTETEIVAIALKNEFISSLTESQEHCFTNCINSIFSYERRNDEAEANLAENILAALRSLNLVHSNYSEVKVKEILSALEINRQLIITGEVCSGKTHLISLAMQILSNKGTCFKRYYVNPMTLTMPHDRKSWDKEAFDQILTAILESTTHKQKCIILDSLLDESWLASIAFDQNCIRSDSLKVFCEPKDVNIIIETVDLQFATPASLASYTIIHVDNKNVTWRQIISIWLETKIWNEIRIKDELQCLTESYLEIFLNFKNKNCSQTLPHTNASIIHTFCELFQNIFSTWSEEKILKDELNLMDAIRKLFFFCSVWSVGGMMNETERLKYDVLLREQVSDSTASFPLKGNVFQYFILITNTTSSWIPWNDHYVKHSNKNVASSNFVYTSENMPYHFVSSILMKSHKPLLITSNTTVGKSALIQNILTNTNGDEQNVCYSNFTDQTSVHSLRRILAHHSIKISQEILYPKERKNLVWFIDDLHNVADLQTVDACEFLRHLIEHRSWHEHNHPQCLKQTSIVAAMRNRISLHQCGTSFARLLNQFHIINHENYNDENAASIFNRKIKSITQIDVTRTILSSLPSATIDLIRKLSARLPPTPVKPRYQFSLKTISRILEKCCLLSQKTNLADSSNFLRLWIHECYRETWDLLDKTDYKIFYDVFNDTISRFFDATLHGLCPGNESPIFCDILCQDSSYQDVTDVNILAQHIETTVDPNSSLIVHHEAVKHASKVLRILKTAAAHIVLVGTIGSGRETICQIAACASKNTTIQMLDMQPDDDEEVVDSKVFNLFECCKTNPTMCVVRIDQYNAINIHLMDILNSIIVNDTVAGYYPCSRNSCITLEESSWNQIKLNLHIVLIVPMEKYQYWKIYNTYSSMLSKTTTNCVHSMSEKSLSEISGCFLLKNVVFDVPLLDKSKSHHQRKRESLIQSTEERMHIAVSDAVSRIHSAVAYELRNSTENLKALDCWYFELLHTIKRFFYSKRECLSNIYNKYHNGIHQIQEATHNVAKLKIDLEKQQEQIALYQHELDEFIDNIQVQTANADLQNQEVAIKRETIGAEEIICKELATIAEADLEKAMPALNAAIAALDSLNKKDMNEIKSYSRPPVKVELVLNAVMILLGKEPTWVEAKRQLGEQKFLDILRNFDKNNMGEKTLKTIGGYVRNPDLEPNKIGMVSKAAKSLMLWVRAIENYGKVYKYVGPKIRKMEDAKTSLREKQLSLREAELKLIELAEQLSALRTEYENKMKCKFELEDAARIMILKLERSQALVDGLSGEKIRWTNTAQDLKTKYSHLIGDTLMAAASLVYFGTLPCTARESLRSQWKVDLEALELTFTDNFSTFAFFYSTDDLQTWQSLGLPDDELTVENASILLNSNVRVPLVVDPQGEIQRWIIKLRGMTKSVRYNLDEDITQHQIEADVYEQKHLLVHSVQETNLHHFDQLEKIYRKSLQKLDRSQWSYSLIGTTSENVPYIGKLKKTANMINFILGKSGLEVKLLATVIEHENPFLEDRKALLIETITSSKATLAKLEDNILRILNESQVPLIDNEELIESLESSKQTAESVKIVLEHAASTKYDIEISRETYSPCAARASLLFFVLEDLKCMDPTYRFSLDWYIALFHESLEKSGKTQNIEERKVKIIDHHTFNVSRNVCLALSFPDQVIFTFYLCVRLLYDAETMSVRAFNFFVHGADKIDRHEQTENPSPDWINSDQWDNLTELDKLPGFRGITQSFEEHNDAWKLWCSSPHPENESLPENWERNLTLFQKYTLVRSVRLDRLEPCMKNFVANNLGKEFLDFNRSTLNDILEKSTPAIPIMLISSDNYNPLQEVHNFSKFYKKKSHKIVQYVNMSTEPMESVVKHLKKCIQTEKWLYVDECQKSKSWLSQFDHILQYLCTVNPESKFRLWMHVNKEEKHFPVHILQNCLKYMCNPPAGIKYNMKSMLEQIGEEQFRKIEKSRFHLQHKKLMFTLAFFHSLLIERNKYQSLGWNKPYQFNIMDFKLSERLITYCLEELMESKYKTNLQTQDTNRMRHYEVGQQSRPEDSMLWRFMKNAVLEVGYGSQITNTWDQRIFNTYSTDIFRQELIATSQCSFVSDDQAYKLPRDGNFTSYINFITNQLPQEDSIKVLGQNENANIKYLESRSAYVLQMLHQVQLHAEATLYDQQRGIMDYEKAKKMVMELLKKLPVCLDYDNAARIVSANKTPVNECLLLEIVQYNEIIELVRENLEQLMSMISGENSLSQVFLEILLDIKRNKVPQAWIKYLTDKHLSDWAIDMKNRIEHIRKWSESGQLLTEITLGNLLKPTLFLHSFIMMHAEIYSIPLTELTWDITVLSTTKPMLHMAPAEGFIARGLYLYNGGWNLQDQCLKLPQILKIANPMPPILFKPTRKKDSNDKSSFSCPCFYNCQKSDDSFIMTIELNSGDIERETCIKMNTCLLLNL